MKHETTRGFTLVELLMVVAVIGVLVAIAVPSLFRARMAANESSAIGSLRAVVSAQHTFASSAARGGFVPTLPRLGVACGTDPTPFLSNDLTVGPIVQKSGFTFTMVSAAGSMAAALDCNGAPTTTGFYVTAAPITPSVSGTRAFAVRQEGSIWENLTSPVIVPPTEADMNAPPTPVIHPLR